MNEHRTYCRFCIAACGVVVEVDEQEQVVGVRGDVDHPTSRGYLCPKGRALGLNHHDPRRLDQPLMGRADEREAVGWDRCLDDAAARLADIVERYGPSSVAFLTGNGGSFDASGRWALERLQRRLGSRTKYTNMTVDTPAKPVVGTLMGGFPSLVPAIDHEAATMTVLIGCNPVVSHGHMNSFPDPVRRLRALAEQGELWVIDPRRTETAELATDHLAIRPGTDYALLAHAVREVLGSGADTEYVAEHTVGVDELAAAVQPFDLDVTCRITGLQAEAIEGFVAAIRRHGRIAMQSGTGSTFSTRSTVSEWLVWALSIVTGSYDRPGGMWFHPGFFKQFDQRELTTLNSPSFGPGPASRPDLPNVTGEMPATGFADEVLSGNVRAAIFAGLNPLTSYPDLERQLKALDTLDVAIVADVVANDLTDRATHVLPVSGPLERADLSYWADFLMMDVSGQHTARVVQPGGDRRPQWQALAQLGARLGLDVIAEGVDPDTIGEEEIMDRVGRGGRRTVDELRVAPSAVVADTSVFGWVHEQVLPEGRWRLAPAALVTSLAELVDIAEPPADSLTLISARQLRHANFQLAGVPLGGGHRDEPTLLINPRDAKQLGAEHGATVRVESRAGAVTTTLEVTERIIAGVVGLPQGFQDVNVTALVSDDEA
ncbi:MAG: molybdopterin-dependent oxidoreductase, partial [Actinomycetota bacterium]|nr:molybdopterin-dependent oxidoreductase [Actinomycetota bacterium]